MFYISMSYLLIVLLKSQTLGCKMVKPKKHDWQSKCLSIGHSCLSSTFSDKLLIDSWCSTSKDINLICDQNSKCLWGPFLMCNGYFRSLLIGQKVLRSSTSPLCFIFTLAWRSVQSVREDIKIFEVPNNFCFVPELQARNAKRMLISTKVLFAKRNFSTKYFLRRYIS